MPGKEICSQIKDPDKRKRCEEYSGEFSRSRGSSLGGYTRGGTTAPSGSRKKPQSGSY